MASQTPSTNLGAVVSVRGSVVDVRFDQRLPPIYSLLRAGATDEIVIEVLAQRDAQPRARHRADARRRASRAA